MISRSIMALSCINMGLALYVGFYVPTEHHAAFALTIRDYFLLSSTAFALSLYGVLKK
jgi:hypothetical protein